MAPAMAAACRRKVAAPNLLAVAADAECLPATVEFAAIVSGLTLQWFSDWRAALAGLRARLAAGGVLLCSWVGPGSFAQWRAACRLAGLPCTVNSLPPADFFADMPQLAADDISAWQRRFTLEYPSAMDFFRSLARTGAAASRGAARLSPSGLRRLARVWDAEAGGRVRVTHEVCYLRLRRRGGEG